MIDDLARLYLLRTARATPHPPQRVAGFLSPPPIEGGRSQKEGHMHNEPVSYSRPVEAKVKWAALGTFVGSVAATAVLQAVDADHSLIEVLPDWLEAVVIPLIPTALSWVAGWRARHTARPDLPESQR